ncbi:MAG TPA: formate dehydrogenase subunit gamma, partial [Steroidobacteraceae bacterium]|nr:formate dehydrogenase subunit gamma [Steroidobacteraceae bacterium]
MSGAPLTIVDDILARFKDQSGVLIEVLHAVQNALGYVPPESIRSIAHELNLSRAEVFGVVTFYHWFRQTPPGKNMVRVCRAEACQARGGVAVEAAIKKTLGIDYHETTSDGQYSLEPVYCLGNCACGPSVMIDNEVHGNVTTEKLSSLFAAAAVEKKSDVASKSGAAVFVSGDTASQSLGSNRIVNAIIREARVHRL